MIIYIFMKTICLSDHGFLESQALGHMMRNYPFLASMNQKLFYKLKKEQSITGLK